MPSRYSFDSFLRESQLRPHPQNAWVLDDDAPLRPDEDVYGVTYDQIGDFLEGKAVDQSVAETIVHAYRATAHKRALPVAHRSISDRNERRQALQQRERYRNYAEQLLEMSIATIHSRCCRNPSSLRHSSEETLISSIKRPQDEERGYVQQFACRRHDRPDIGLLH
ncbi:hypothetical protein [Brevundimonas faecalis]|uniref:hypothetical protein n=1 Tax=Brevundimonas TaxID=41275 RepID=UPI00360A3413